MSEAQNSGSGASEGRPIRLRDALRQARIEAADRTGVVVDLRDAEVARLEILGDALDPLFAQVPQQFDLFGESRPKMAGDMPAWSALPVEARSALIELIAQLILEHADKSRIGSMTEAGHDL